MACSVSPMDAPVVVCRHPSPVLCVAAAGLSARVASVSREELQIHGPGEEGASEAVFRPRWVRMQRIRMARYFRGDLATDAAFSRAGRTLVVVGTTVAVFRAYQSARCVGGPRAGCFRHSGRTRARSPPTAVAALQVVHDAVPLCTYAPHPARGLFAEGWVGGGWPRGMGTVGHADALPPCVPQLCRAVSHSAHLASASHFALVLSKVSQRGCDGSSCRHPPTRPCSTSKSGTSTPTKANRRARRLVPGQRVLRGQACRPWWITITTCCTRARWWTRCGHRRRLPSLRRGCSRSAAQLRRCHR